MKTKPKKLNKNQSKAKKDEIVVDKTYILDLESQINEHKSTLDLYKRSTANSDNQVNHNPQTAHSNPSGTKECESGCRHRCCDELYSVFCILFCVYIWLNHFTGDSSTHK